MNRSLQLLAAGGTALLAGLLIGGPVAADPPHTPRVTEFDQVSDQATAHASITDPNLVNAWGLALGPTTPLWVANNGTNTATIYTGGLDGVPVGKSSRVVSIPGGAPTGQAFNNTSDFVVTGPGGSGPALFLFASEGGDITAWNPTAAPTAAVLEAHVDGAIYKGLALAQTPFGPVLLATDFHDGRIDVFDRQFHRIVLPPVFFHDPRLPAGYAPFNVLVTGDTVYVSYAKQSADAVDEVDGPGLGFVDAYTDLGVTVHRIASRGTLNAPWGLAVAPAGFGRFTGALLVGNFGDGHINAYAGDHFLGQLRNQQGKPVVIDGLWALLPGTASTGGTGTLWFSAGPNDEADGLVGQLIPSAG